MKKQLINLLFITMLIAGCSLFQDNTVYFSLVRNNVNLIVGEEYVEPGCKVVYRNKSSECIVSNNINTNVAGEYQVIYTNPYNKEVLTRTVIVHDLQLQFDQSYRFNNNSPLFYDLGTKEPLSIYKNKQSFFVLEYVDAEDFIKLLKGIIHSLEVEKTATEIIFSFDQYVFSFDSENHLFKTNNFDYLNYLDNIEDDSAFSSLDLSQEVVTSGASETIINLKKYDYYIINQDNRFYLPFSIAETFLTGSFTSLYLVNNEIYLADYFYGVQFNWDVTSNPHFNRQYLDYVNNYYAFFLDNFYGLKDYKNFDVYQYLYSFDFSSSESPEQLNQRIVEMLYRLDDLHTAASHPFYIYTPTHIQKEKGTKLNTILTAAKEYSCSVLLPVSSSLSAKNTLLTVKINIFDETIESYLDIIFDNLNPAVKAVSFDLTCNTGGTIGSIYHLLKYLTDRPIEFNLYNDANKTYSQVTGNSKVAKALTNVQLFLQISPVTFSAANLVASIVKDNQLATIVGEQSLGGTCAVAMMIGFDGTIITYSSNQTILLNKEKQMIEEGIKPDHQIKGTKNIRNYIENVIK